MILFNTNLESLAEQIGSEQCVSSCLEHQEYGKTGRPSTRELYLDLLQNTLAFSLWPEPPVSIRTYNYLNPFFKRKFLGLLSRIASRFGLQIVQERHYTKEQREEGMLWPGMAHTMIGLYRLRNLRHSVETVIQEGIEGDLIETGVWRGGACILMRAVLAAYGVVDRRVFVADSFEGLPKPDEDKYVQDKGDQHHIHKFLAVSKEEVEENFRKYGMLDDQVVFLKGWFKDTLPNAPISKLAVLRLDGDMYGSTIETLETLYPKLSAGGFCIIDDYALSGCKAAVDDFRAANSITTPLEVIDYTGVYWRKE